MKNLLLMRHATAAEKEFGQADYDRVLTLFGERQAGEAGLWLKEQELLPELVLCSPAVRTRTTCEQLLSALEKKVPVQLEKEIYQGTETDLLHLVQDVDADVETLMVLGHNPTIEFFAGQLATTADDTILFSPATIVWLQFKGTHWYELKPHGAKVAAVHRG